MDDKEKKNWLEKFVLVTSVVVVGVVLVFLVYRVFTDETVPPNIDVQYGAAEAKPNYMALPIKVSNRGTQTAENVRVEITVGVGENMQISEIDFAYIPGQSSVEGWACFESIDPDEQIETRVISYTSP